MSTLLARFAGRLYVQLSPERLTVRNPKSGQTISEVPEAAIGGPAGRPAQLLATGSAARAAAAAAPGVTLANPFAHPRSLLSDFTTAQAVLKSFVRRAAGKSAWMQAAPIIVMHPLGEHAGGLTQIELRALRELAFGAGASEVILWQGPELGDEQLLSLQLPAEGQRLDG